MQFETERLILRPWDLSDAKWLYTYAKDPKVSPSAGWLCHTSIADSRHTINDILSKPETYAVVYKAFGHVVGNINIMIGSESNLQLPDTEGELGYWIGRPFWGKGLIPEAVKVMTAYAFDRLHLEKLWCGYFAGNVQSKRVQEKCGFRYHHTNTNVYWALTNEVKTEHIACLEKAEYQKNSRQK